MVSESNPCINKGKDFGYISIIKRKEGKERRLIDVKMVC